MTNEEYALLRSIAAADCTEGPNFDPALLTELLDAFDALERVQAELTTERLRVAYWRDHALAQYDGKKRAVDLVNRVLLDAGR